MSKPKRKSASDQGQQRGSDEAHTRREQIKLLVGPTQNAVRLFRRIVNDDLDLAERALDQLQAFADGSELPSGLQVLAHGFAKNGGDVPAIVDYLFPKHVGFAMVAVDILSVIAAGHDGWTVEAAARHILQSIDRSEPGGCELTPDVDVEVTAAFRRNGLDVPSRGERDMGKHAGARP